MTNNVKLMNLFNSVGKDDGEGLFGEIINLSVNRCIYLDTTSNIRAFNKARATIATRYLNKPGNEEELFDRYLMDLKRVYTYELPKQGYRFTKEEIKFLEKIVDSFNKSAIRGNFREIIKQEGKADELPRISAEFVPVIKDTLVKYGKIFESVAKGAYVETNQVDNIYVKADKYGREILSDERSNDLLSIYQDFREEYQGLNDVVGLTVKETGFMYIMDCDDMVAGLKEKQTTKEQIEDFYKYMTDLCKSFLRK